MEIGQVKGVLSQCRRVEIKLKYVHLVLFRCDDWSAEYSKDAVGSSLTLHRRLGGTWGWFGQAADDLVGVLDHSHTPLETTHTREKCSHEG